MRISKLNLESRGTFADLSYPTIIVTNTNIIMLSVRRILESNKSASETKVRRQRSAMTAAALVCLEPEIGSHGDVTSPLRYSIGFLPP